MLPSANDEAQQTVLTNLSYRGIDVRNDKSHDYFTTKDKNASGSMISYFKNRIGDLKRERSKLMLQRDDLMLQRDDLMLQRDDLMLQRDDLMLQRDDLMLQRDDLMKQRDELMLHQVAQLELPVGDNDVVVGPHSRYRQHLPIVLTTLPKSGSIFILRNLEKMFDTSYVRIGPGYFPNENIDMFLLQELVARAGVSQSHFPATSVNLRLLANVLQSVWVHFRDPRSATLSWTHHVRKLREHPLPLATVCPELPTDYFDRTFDQQLSWQIGNYLPLTVAWMRDWQRAADSGTSGMRVLITTFEEMIADPVAFMVRVGAWHGAEMSGLNHLPVEKSEENHFRNGRLDEWMTAFSDNDKRLAARFIDADLAKRHGWVML